MSQGDSLQSVLLNRFNLSLCWMFVHHSSLPKAIRQAWAGLDFSLVEIFGSLIVLGIRLSGLRHQGKSVFDDNALPSDKISDTRFREIFHGTSKPAFSFYDQWLPRPRKLGWSPTATGRNSQCSSYYASSSGKATSIVGRNTPPYAAANNVSPELPPTTGEIRSVRDMRWAITPRAGNPNIVVRPI